ncbi:MAG: response regulator, partial [Elusimicrobia bacterium]|nr:response regulator [Elusimicrobiota bacterium]
VEALGILQHESFEWMITDARMLPVNGFDLSREAKRLRPNMRVLMVSAVSTETDIQGYPIEKVFPKPIPVEQLLECLAGAS